MKVKVVTKVLVDGQEVARDKLTCEVTNREQAVILRARAMQRTQSLADRLIAQAGFNV